MVSWLLKIFGSIFQLRYRTNYLLMTEILPNLYLGGKRDVIQEQYNRVFSVLSIDEKNQFNFDHQRIIRMDDSMEQEVLSIIPLVANKIEKSLKKGDKILIHCHAGVSRSATLVIGYLMIKHNMSYEQAYIHVRMKRNVCPNNNFIRQLKILG